MGTHPIFESDFDCLTEMSRHRHVASMIDEYYEDDYNDYDDYDDEYCAPPPPPKPKPKATKPAKKTITPKAKVDSPKTTPKLDQLAKKVAKINLVAELEKRSKEKPIVSVVVVGHIDAGKSTLVAQLSQGAGNLDERERRKLQKSADEQGKSSFGLAYMMDATEAERERGVTIDVGEAKLIEMDQYQLALLDAPGHKDFVPAMISRGAASSDSGLVILDASIGNFESGFERRGQTREHLIILRALGCASLIVAVNKMDAVQWSRERFDQIKSDVNGFLKSIGFAKTKFVPISGLTGEGVCQKAPAEWYKGDDLLSHFRQIPLPDRVALRQRPLRATVLEYGSDSKGVTLRVRLECGTVAVGDKIRICPTMNDAIVHDIIEPPVKVLTVPDIADIRVAGVQLDEVAPVNMISSYNLACPRASRFTCQVKILNAAMPIIPGLPVMFYSRGNALDASVKKLNALLDSNGAVVKTRPKVLKSKDFASIDIVVRNGINIEKWEDVKELSRMILRYSGETIGIGKIINYTVG